MKTIDEAAEEIMFAAISPKLETEGGCYVQNSQKARALKDSDKVKYHKALWDLTRECIDGRINV